MGTVITLDVRSDIAEPVVQGVLDKGAALLAGVDEDFSTYSEDSWITRLNNHHITSTELPDRVRDVLVLAAQAERRTRGWFTPRWRGGTAVDPTGLVKGWAAQRVSDLFLACGLGDHCINAAGDVVLAGQPAPGRRWRVGVADAVRPGVLIGFTDGTSSRAGPTFGDNGQRWAVATSGVSERGPHVLDPTTATPATGLLSATVIDRCGGHADAYATAVVAAAGHPDLIEEIRALGAVTVTVTDSGNVRDPFGYLQVILLEEEPMAATRQDSGRPRRGPDRAARPGTSGIQ